METKIPDIPKMVKAPPIPETPQIKCDILRVLAFIATLAFLLLNGYMTYLIAESFTEDGWSFMGGLFIAVGYVVTIPLNIFAYIMTDRLKTRKNASWFFIVLGAIGSLIGAILFNATSLWIYILVFSLILLGFSIKCLSKHD
jgi:MFS family permease